MQDIHDLVTCHDVPSLILQMPFESSCETRTAAHCPRIQSTKLIAIDVQAEKNNKMFSPTGTVIDPLGFTDTFTND